MVFERERAKRDPDGPLRIALVMRDYDSGKGGAERYFVNLSRALAKMGHEVHIVAAVFAEPETQGIVFHSVPMMKKPSFLRILGFFLESRKMIREMRDDLDIVQSLTMVYPCDVFRLGGEVHREWMKVRCPSLMERFLKHLFNPVHILNYYFEKKIMERENTGWVITISELEKRILRKYYDYPEDRITVVYNGVDHGQFHPGVKKYRSMVRCELGLRESEVVALFAANNFQRKGLDAVVSALARLAPDERPRVLVLGRGKAIPYVRQARHLGVERSLLFHGPVGDPERFYGAADFFVLPSRYDSFANVHLEALACGLPVITTKMAGGSEVVQEGKTGFVIERTDEIDALAHAFREMMNPVRRDAMSRRAPETATGFTLERNAGETVAVYKSILSVDFLRDQQRSWGKSEHKI
ncbi:MAG: glycosyltransferase family 4 protein [Deltaproteobacteria bacterium]|nr:glycosyltransferase family 4 protein [Deltaproteobacteria bacterium]